MDHSFPTVICPLKLSSFLHISGFTDLKFEQAFVEHELAISHTTIVDWYRFTRAVCICILENFSKKIGDPGKIVEIDKSKFGKRKYHR